MRTLSLNLVGTAHYRDSGRVIRRALGCKSHCLRAVALRREPNNPSDPNAIAVECQGRKIGYISRKQAAGLASELPIDAPVGGQLLSPKMVEIRLK